MIRASVLQFRSHERIPPIANENVSRVSYLQLSSARLLQFDVGNNPQQNYVRSSRGMRFVRIGDVIASAAATVQAGPAPDIDR